MHVRTHTNTWGRGRRRAGETGGGRTRSERTRLTFRCFRTQRVRADPSVRTVPADEDLEDVTLPLPSPPTAPEEAKSAEEGLLAVYSLRRDSFYQGCGLVQALSSHPPAALVYDPPLFPGNTRYPSTPASSLRFTWPTDRRTDGPLFARGTTQSRARVGDGPDAPSDPVTDVPPRARVSTL